MTISFFLSDIDCVLSEGIFPMHADELAALPSAQVGCDGPSSRVRQLCGFEEVGWRYNQTSVVATLHIQEVSAAWSHEAVHVTVQCCCAMVCRWEETPQPGRDFSQLDPLPCCQ